jgi:tripartite-type tricarboxylate transporter receptor subunit TctC
MKRTLIVTAVSAALATFMPSAALAQSWPTKPVRMVAPFAPGGPVDLTARILAQHLGEAFKQQFVVDNRTGASGTIGAEQVARAAPDGHTLLVSASVHVIVPSLFPKLSYDAIRDFAPVSVVSTSPLVLVVTPSLPVGSVKEFVALAKRHPGELSFGSSGSGSSTHLTAELLKSVTGTKMTHIPYKGQGQAITDVVTGEIQFMFNSPSAVKAFIDAKRLRVLGTTSDKRSPQMPEVPTFAESGFKDLVTGSWYAVWLPAKTPEAIVSRLNSEIVRITKLPDVSRRIVELGGVPVANSPSEMDAFQKIEAVRWAKVVKESGAKMD